MSAQKVFCFALVKSHDPLEVLMIDDLFSGLVEDLVGVVVKVTVRAIGSILEILGEILCEAVGDLFCGRRAEERDVAEAIKRSKFPTGE
jgi:hypothetical protein